MAISRRNFIKTAGLGLLGLSIGGPSSLFSDDKKRKPNIVLLFADDAGYNDFGFQKSFHFITPNLDRLEKSGIKFNQMYVTASVCGPSRAGLMTGMYQQRFGFEENNVPGIMSKNSKFLGEDMGLPTDIPTMADYLKELGYRTGAFGKWHLGIADRYHPTKRGFDEFYGFRGGARSYFAYPNPEKVERDVLMERGFGNFEEPEGYLTNVLANEVCSFIERNKEKPFFAYVAFNAVHRPMQIDPQDKDRFPELEGKRRILAQMTYSLDRACGQIVEKLKQLNLYNNTLIVFSNDNGGPTGVTAASNYPLAGTKGTQLEGGIRVPGFIVWPEVLPGGKVYNYPVSTLDLLPTFVAAAGGDPNKIKGLDGVNLLPYLLGKKKDRPHQTLYWKMEWRAVIRDRDFKLVVYADRPAELFNIEEDPSEQDNLAEKYPDKVKELYKKLFKWELTLERPMFMLRRQEEEWSHRRYDNFRQPPPKTF